MLIIRNLSNNFGSYLGLCNSDKVSGVWCRSSFGFRMKSCSGVRFILQNWLHLGLRGE